jgi:hypothetical protein
MLAGWPWVSEVPETVCKVRRLLGSTKSYSHSTSLCWEARLEISCSEITNLTSKCLTPIAAIVAFKTTKEPSGFVILIPDKKIIYGG